MDRQREIGARERLILGLLLAFCVDTLRPAAHPAAHQHAGGELPHVHVGEVASDPGIGHPLLFAAGLTQRNVPADGTRALAASSPTALHVHLFRPLQVAHVTPLAPVPTIGRHQPACTRTYGDERTATKRRSTARAPPLLPT